MIKQIRVSITKEVNDALLFLKNKKYPILSFPEIIRVVLSKEVAKERRKTIQYSEPTTEELMQTAEEAIMVNDKEEMQYNEEDIKRPFTYERHV